MDERFSFTRYNARFGPQGSNNSAYEVYIDVHPAGEEEVGNVLPEMRYEVIIDKESGKNVSNMVDLILQLTGPSVIEANKKCVLLTTSAVK